MHETGPPTTIIDRLLFLWRALRSPRALGSVTPSSHYLVDALLRHANVAAVDAVVELGPGTGPFTAGLLAQMHPTARLLCIERDAALAGRLRVRFADPRLTVVVGDARDLERHLATLGFPSAVPLIVSGLPFTSLPKDVRQTILTEVVRCLEPGGLFLLYQYSPFIRPLLRRHFREVESTLVLRNIPPALVMRCH